MVTVKKEKKMERKSSFLRKLKTELLAVLCLTLVVGTCMYFGEKKQNRKATAAECEDLPEHVGSKTSLEKVGMMPETMEKGYAIQPLEEASTGTLLKAAAYRIVCGGQNESEAKEVKYEEITTAALGVAAMEAVEQETLQLMSSPAGTTYGGMMKVYAGKMPLLISEDDKEVLLRIVEAEATSEDVKGRMLVANVVLNRVLCDGFPDTIAEVVFQKNGNVYQFSPIKDGRYWSVEISEETREAVERVLAGEDESQGALFFVARRMANQNAVRWFDEALQYLFQYGVHEFYKNK